MPNRALLGDREKGSLIQRKEAHGSIARKRFAKRRRWKRATGERPRSGRLDEEPQMAYPALARVLSS
jgi:hypothetical protein